MAVIETRRGNKVRSDSNRRFIVIIEWGATGGASKAAVDKRSDDLNTARAHVSRKGNSFGGGEFIERVIFDTVTGEFVR